MGREKWPLLLLFLTLANTETKLLPTGVLSTSFDIQTPLSTVWTNLKNRVFGNKITISLPLPDPMGNVDLSIDTSKLDTTQVGLGLDVAVVVMWTSVSTSPSWTLPRYVWVWMLLWLSCGSQCRHLQAGQYPGRPGSGCCCGCHVDLSIDTTKLVDLAVVVMWTSVSTSPSWTVPR